MKMAENTINDELAEPTEIRLRARAVEKVPLEIPIEALASLKEVAARRDMSVHALLKLYIGSGLRQDVAQIIHENDLETKDGEPAFIVK
jgi:hypothetical protein